MCTKWETKFPLYIVHCGCAAFVNNKLICFVWLFSSQIALPIYWYTWRSVFASVFNVCYVFQGYLLIENFFTEEELNPCKDAINLLVDQLANKLYDAGKIKSMLQLFNYNIVKLYMQKLKLRDKCLKIVTWFKC